MLLGQRLRHFRLLSALQKYLLLLVVAEFLGALVAFFGVGVADYLQMPTPIIQIYFWLFHVGRLGVVRELLRLLQLHSLISHKSVRQFIFLFDFFKFLLPFVVVGQGVTAQRRPLCEIMNGRDFLLTTLLIKFEIYAVELKIQIASQLMIFL